MGDERMKQNVLIIGVLMLMLVAGMLLYANLPPTVTEMQKILLGLPMLILVIAVFYLLVKKK